MIQLIDKFYKIAKNSVSLSPSKFISCGQHYRHTDTCLGGGQNVTDAHSQIFLGKFVMSAPVNWNKWPIYVQRKAALEKAKYSDPTKVNASMDDNEEINAKDVVAWIYSVLTTLDGKASALMRLNGVLIAAAAFLLGLFDQKSETLFLKTNFDVLIIIWSALLSAFSIGLCLLVVNVS